MFASGRTHHDMPWIIFCIWGSLCARDTRCRGNKITVCGSRNIHIHPIEVVWGGWGAVKGKFLRKVWSSTGASKGKEGLKLKRPPWEVGELDIFWNNTWYAITNIINYFDLQSTLAGKIHYLHALIIWGAWSINWIFYTTMSDCLSTS